MLIILCKCLKENIVNYVFVYLIAIFYYLAFCINTQAHEFRYYAPTFYILFALVICMIVNIIFRLRKYYGKYKKVIIYLCIIVISINLFGIKLNIPRIQASNLSDENWEKGIRKGNNIILFDNNKNNLTKIKDASQLKFKDEVVEIEHVESDEMWIRVYVDNKELQKFEYPNYITINK